MKKILFYTDSRQFGGAEKYLSILIQGLNRDKYEIIFISKDQNICSKIGKNNVQIKNLPFRNFSLFNLIRIFRNEKPQIIHVNFYVPCTCVWAVLAAKIVGIPYIIGTVHSTVLTTTNIPFVRFFKKAIVLLIYHFVDLFITVSDKSKEELCLNYKIRNKNVMVIYNGIDFMEYNYIDAEKVYYEKARLGLKENTKVVGVVSRLVKNKGIEVFISSIPDILKDFPNARFLIVGEGDLFDRLKDLTIALGVKDEVFLTGYKEDIKMMLALIDIFVVSSLHESFPLNVMEAMAAKLPVVATNVGGIPELVDDGVTGILIPPNNPKILSREICKLLKDPSKYKEMGQWGRDRVGKYFSSNEMIENTEKIYDKLLTSL